MEDLKHIMVVLAEIKQDLEELKARSRETQWVKGKDLAKLLGQRPRWPEVWRNHGLFTLEEGLVRNVGSSSAPRYEYNLKLCRDRWDWWSGLTADAKKAFLGREDAA